MKDGKRLVALSFVLCFALALFSPIKAHAFFGLFEDDAIAIVKDGTFNFDQSVTIGNVLDNHPYLYNQEWTSFEDNQKRKFVQLKANVPVKLIEKYGNEKSADIIQSVLNEKSVYDEYIDDTKLVLQFIIYEGQKKFDLSYCGLEGKGQELDTRGYNANMVLKELYANEMPYKITILGMILRSHVIDNIARATNNFTQTFHQLTINSDFVFEHKNNGTLFSDSQKWHDLGIDSSRSYFKINNINYNSIELEGIFFLTQSFGDAEASPSYEYTMEKVTLPITDWKYKNPKDFYLKIKDGKKTFFIRKGIMDDAIYATVNLSDTIDKKSYSTFGNTFICDESAKQNLDIGWTKYYGVYIGQDKETGSYCFEEGTGEILSFASKNGSYLDNSQIGRAFIISVAKDKVFSINRDNTKYEPEFYSLEGIAVEITDEYWILQSTDGKKYKFNINHNQAYDLRRTVLRNQYQYVEGKGLAVVGYQGRLITGTWTVSGFTQWFYDPQTGLASKTNFATKIKGPHETPQNQDSYHEFIAMPN